MTMVGQTLGDRYRLDALIGAGGMATVYRARDLRLERDVAVKVLSPNLAADPALAQRFDREARFLAAVGHTAIVAVYDVGESDGDPWYVMELVEGESLADRLAAAGRLPPGEIVPVVAAVADGLATLHERGFVHRDVKPHNILLAPAGAKLADFGLVRDAAASELTAPGTTVGTLAYLAPELLRGEPASPASDVYALAAVAYVALSGRLPYPADTVAGLVAAHATPPPPPSEVVPEVGRAFDEPLMTALGPAESRPDAARFAALLRAPDTAGASGPAVGAAAGTAVGAAAGAALGAAAGADEPTRPGAIVPAAAAPVTTRPVRRIRGGRSRTLTPWLAPLAVLAIAAVVLFLLSGAAGRRPAADNGTATATPTEAAAEPTDAPTATPIAAATPTAAPPADPAASVMTALDEFDSAVEAAQGGRDGLRGNDANDLRQRAEEVRRALAGGDGEEIVNKADELVKKTEEVVDKAELGDTDTGQALVSSAENVLSAARAGFGGGGDDDGGEGDG